MKISCTRNTGFRKDTEMLIAYFMLVSFGGSEICSTSCQCLLIYRIVQITVLNKKKVLKMNSKDVKGRHC
jgi:hypothetical protein